MKHSDQDLVMIPGKLSDDPEKEEALLQYARITVCELAYKVGETDPLKTRGVLESLGLIDPKVPSPKSSRAAQKQRASQLRRTSRQAGGK